MEHNALSGQLNVQAYRFCFLIQPKRFVIFTQRRFNDDFGHLLTNVLKRDFTNIFFLVPLRYTKVPRPVSLSGKRGCYCSLSPNGSFTCPYLSEHKVGLFLRSLYNFTFNWNTSNHCTEWIKENTIS